MNKGPIDREYAIKQIEKAIAEANPEEKERTATLTFKAGTATATATVKQAPKEKTEEGGDDSGEEGKNGSSVEDMENKKW